jgi:hypothetical protein
MRAGQSYNGIQRPSWLLILTGRDVTEVSVGVRTDQT